MSGGDPVRAYLEERGASEAILAEGLEGLVQRWGEIVRAVETRYNYTLDQYLNDLDVRGLIEGAARVAPRDLVAFVRPDLEELDARMLAATVPTHCLWGHEVQDEEGFTEDRDWWYFRRPAQPGASLLHDLEEQGIP